jgi:hypothetical protein
MERRTMLDCASVREVSPERRSAERGGEEDCDGCERRGYGERESRQCLTCAARPNKGENADNYRRDAERSGEEKANRDWSYPGATDGHCDCKEQGDPSEQRKADR